MAEHFEIISALNTVGVAQVPPDVKIRIGTGLGDIVRMVGIGPTRVGRYAADTEYWRWGAGADFRGVTSLELSSESFRETGPAPSLASGMNARALAMDVGSGEQALDEFFAPFSSELTHPRVIRANDWLEGARDVPSGRTGHLFWAYDPDNAARKIGLMVEQTAVGALKAFIWYKTFRRVDCQIWGSYPSSRKLVLTRVVNALGNHSTDPRNITPDATWYYVVMGSPLDPIAPAVRGLQSIVGRAEA